MEGRSLGLIKGSWTREEDTLLRKCIEKYGEGKWHLVPYRAGLRRCRKSCRLRWLNYLKPDIKRGKFTLDEADLIFRLHKLLVNRWSLIAGRLPGRTANDIKNYWNSKLSKENISGGAEVSAHTTVVEKKKIYRPKPWRFKDSRWLTGLSSFTTVDNTSGSGDMQSQASPPRPPPQDDSMLWWENALAVENEKAAEKGKSCSFDASGEEFIKSFWLEETESVKEGGETSAGEGKSTDCYGHGLSFDVNIWDILELEKELIM
uniref:Transcription factor MYB90-like n=1 Tax=Nelumbo nucifera TaxID=4432 RepID=A0A822XVT0_NELNU|nr:TPA_asm: hypothetical protein HUJ06_025901 [Nelumbo nucifera]